MYVTRSPRGSSQELYQCYWVGSVTTNFNLVPSPLVIREGRSWDYTICRYGPSTEERTLVDECLWETVTFKNTFRRLGRKLPICLNVNVLKEILVKGDLQPRVTDEVDARIFTFSSGPNLGETTDSHMEVVLMQTCRL